MQERQHRLTASNFGKVCKLRPTTSTKNTVKQTLYSNFKGNTYTKHGLQYEGIAIAKFETTMGLKVDKCGLFIHERLPFLAASPDGLIGKDGIIEVKCPATAVKYSTIKEAITDKCINENRR